jgi:hypothetical protein
MIGRGLKSMLIFARGPKRRLCDRSALWFVTGEWQACGLETVVVRGECLNVDVHGR